MYGYVNVPRAAELLLPKLAPLWAQSVFEQVFIEHGKQFLRFSPDGFETRPLNDYWLYGNRGALP